MKNRTFLLFLLFMVLGTITSYHYIKNYKNVSNPKNTEPTPAISVKSAQIIFGNISVNAEIADNPASREKGLSYRQNLATGSGMLFIFDSYQRPVFWMKDMNFPIDIIWLKNNEIVDIDKNVPLPDAETSDDYLPKYSPKNVANYVLEVNAGFCEENGIKIGDMVEIRKY